MNSKYEGQKQSGIIEKTEQGNESKEVKLEGLSRKSKQNLELIMSDMGNVMHKDRVLILHWLPS